MAAHTCTYTGENVSDRLEETQIQLLGAQAEQENLKQEIEDYKQQVCVVHHHQQPLNALTNFLDGVFELCDLGPPEQA